MVHCYGFLKIINCLHVFFPVAFFVKTVITNWSNMWFLSLMNSFEMSFHCFSGHFILFPSRTILMWLLNVTLFWKVLSLSSHSWVFCRSISWSHFMWKFWETFCLQMLKIEWFYVETGCHQKALFILSLYSIFMHIYVYLFYGLPNDFFVQIAHCKYHIHGAFSSHELLRNEFP